MAGPKIRHSQKLLALVYITLHAPLPSIYSLNASPSNISNMAQQQSLAKDLFEDMGRKVAEASAREDDDDTRVVDEIESLCMNCHENVRDLL